MQMETEKETKTIGALFSAAAAKPFFFPAAETRVSIFIEKRNEA